MYLLGTATSYIILPPRKYQLVAALLRVIKGETASHWTVYSFKLLMQKL